jgi:hypothetical protein
MRQVSGEWEFPEHGCTLRVARVDKSDVVNANVNKLGCGTLKGLCLDPNDLNKLSEAVGSLAESAFGKAGVNSTNWSQIWKAIHRFTKR